MTEIQRSLFELQDKKYKTFQCKLMPTVPTDTVIGVRTPALRKLGKRLKNDADTASFLTELPHKYYEENNLHAFLICEIQDLNECIAAIDLFLPYVDNWATCDMMRPKSFKGREVDLLSHIERWLNTDHVYTVRFAIEMLMVFFLDEHFNERFPTMISNIKSDKYYVNMMIAWYFATALAKQWNATVPFIEQTILSPWVHNKAIQKAVESYRITPEQKKYLKSLKIKA